MYMYGTSSAALLLSCPFHKARGLYFFWLVETGSEVWWELESSEADVLEVWVVWGRAAGGVSSMGGWRGWGLGGVVESGVSAPSVSSLRPHDCMQIVSLLKCTAPGTFVVLHHIHIMGLAISVLANSIPWVACPFCYSTFPRQPYYDYLWHSIILKKKENKSISLSLHGSSDT